MLTASIHWQPASTVMIKFFRISQFRPWPPANRDWFLLQANIQLRFLPGKHLTSNWKKSTFLRCESHNALRPRPQPAPSSPTSWPEQEKTIMENNSCHPALPWRAWHTRLFSHKSQKVCLATLMHVTLSWQPVPFLALSPAVASNSSTVDSSTCKSKACHNVACYSDRRPALQMWLSSARIHCVPNLQGAGNCLEKARWS